MEGDYLEYDFPGEIYFNPEEFIKNEDWERLSLYYVSDEITEKYKDKLNWLTFVCNWKITPEFYFKYEKYLKQYLSLICSDERLGFLKTTQNTKFKFSDIYKIPQPV